MKPIAILFVLSFFNSIAQTNFKGVVKDKETHEPLIGAIIYFPDLNISAISKEDGAFKINKVPSIKTLIQIQLIGYQSYVKQIDLRTTDSLIVDLEDAHIESNEVVVTGVSKATELKNNPVPMVLISSSYLKENSSTNIIEAVNKIAGINAVTTGPNVSKPFVRGLGFNRILTLFDGVRQEGQQWGDEHGIEIDQYVIDKIEVVKGPASLIYGSDALAGVINLLPSNQVPDGVINGVIQSNYQTNNKLYALSAALNANKHNWQYGLRATKKTAIDYKNKYDGRVYNTGFDEMDLNAYIGTTRKWGYSKLNFSLFSNLQEIPDGSRDSVSRNFTKQVSEEDTIRPIVTPTELNSYKISPIHQNIKHYRLYSTNQIIINQSKLNFKIGYQKSMRQEYSHPQQPTIPGLSLDMHTLTYDLKLFLPEKKQFDITFGLNGFYQTNNTNDGTEFVIPNYNQLDVGPFFHVKKAIKKIELSGGLRYDIRLFDQKALYTTMNMANGFDEVTSNTSGTSKQFDNYSHQFNGLSGSIGATYPISSKTTLKANIARGFRAPNISEISAKGVHPGTGFQQLGDANFKSEFSLQEDIGLFFNNNHFSFSSELFANTISNYIYNQKLKSLLGGDSIYVESGNTYTVYKFKQTTALLYGGEFNLDMHPHPLDWLHIENSLSLIYAVNKGGEGVVITDSNKYLPFIPPLRTVSEIRAELKKISKFIKNGFIKVGVQYYAAQNRVFFMDNTETVTPSYTLLDAGVGTEIYNKNGKKVCQIALFVNNLMDIAYQSNMSRLKYMDSYPQNGSGKSGIYNMGRNWSIKLSIPFSN